MGLYIALLYGKFKILFSLNIFDCMPRKRATLKQRKKRLVFRTEEDLSKFMTGYKKELKERREPQYSYSNPQKFMEFMKKYDPESFNKLLKARKRKRK